MRKAYFTGLIGLSLVFWTSASAGISSLGKFRPEWVSAQAKDFAGLFESVAEIESATHDHHLDLVDQVRRVNGLFDDQLEGEFEALVDRYLLLTSQWEALRSAEGDHPEGRVELQRDALVVFFCLETLALRESSILRIFQVHDAVSEAFPKQVAIWTVPGLALGISAWSASYFGMEFATQGIRESVSLLLGTLVISAGLYPSFVSWGVRVDFPRSHERLLRWNRRFMGGRGYRLMSRFFEEVARRQNKTAAEVCQRDL